MKILFLALFIFSISNVMAASSNCTSGTEEGVLGCLEEQAALLSTGLNKNVGCTTSMFTKLGNGFDPLCQNFIKDDGSLGDYGKTVDSYLNEAGYGSQFFSNDIPGMSGSSGTCPNWSNLSIEQKKNFWVRSTAAIAQDESHCKAGAHNDKPTAKGDRAIGLMQINENVDNRDWRGKNCKGGDMFDPTANLRCGMDIMGGLLMAKEGVYKSNGQLGGKGSNSYWEQLRKKDGGSIGSLISKNPDCAVK